MHFRVFSLKDFFVIANMNSEKDFEETWKETSKGQNTIDDITDKRIWDGINHKIKKKKSGRKLYWIAAVLVPLFALMLIFKPSEDSKRNLEAKYVFETFGVKKNFKLPDGSWVELEPNSKLTLSEKFGEKNREVMFAGQGRFNVAKDKTKPFRINAGEFFVQVLGTQFFLDQRSEEKKVELFEGKVKVEHADKITYLLPKEIWRTDEKNGDFHFYTPEKQKDFTFTNINYSEAIKQLEETYDIKIVYPAEFKNKKVSGAFTGNLNEVVSVISFPFSLKAEKINEKEIILK
ncbi:FecR family protein [Chryseobacterium wanjuense]|uniref:FecR family protein n=2 Tax=Chryseobacterium wanjuense TaxID=356305 RepID=A0A1I0NRW7_9FLAO|nr:FecR family protein [Chryseobacterium wanjuense]